MCATAVLRSHDCLRKPYYSRRNANHNNPNVSGSRRPPRSPPAHHKSQPSPPPTSAAKNNNNNLVMGHVKILKRGEPLPNNCGIDDNNKKKVGPTPIPTTTTAFKKLGLVGRRHNEDDLILCSTGRLGPEPEMVQKQIRASDFYAGSGPVVASPPPSSLPFPAFFSKKEKKIDVATSDLLRLLRLDLP